MGETPTTVNEAVAAADKATNAAIDILVEVAVIAATAEVPFLATPVISTLFRAAVKWVFGLARKPLLKWVPIGVIDAQVKGELKEYHDANEKLAAAKAKGVEDVADLEKEADDAFDRLIHWDGS